MMDSMFLVTLLPLLGQLTVLISCQSSQETPMLYAEVYPDVSREGDSVTLLCRVSNVNVNNHVVTLVKVTDSSVNIIVSSATVDVHGNRFDVSFEQIEASNYFVLNVTIGETLQTDNGTYVCNLNEVSGQGYVSLKREEVLLSVYLVSAFPNCQPRGRSQVDIGSRLVCMSELTPSIFHDCGKWNFAGTLLTKNVTSADHGKTFICLVNVTSYQSLSCNIGPLYITSGLPVLTTGSSAIPNSDLSAAHISGVVIGIIVLIILVAVHILCCRYNPRLCLRAKTYLVKVASSFGTSNVERDSSRKQSDVDMGGSLHSNQDDMPPGQIYENDEQVGTPSVLHTYADMEPSPKKHTADVDQATEYEVVSSLKTKPSQERITEGPGTRPDETASIPLPAQTYMKLNLPDENPDVYTELKR